MKLLFTILTSLSILQIYSQEISVKESSASFVSGSKNSIIVTIPYSTADFIEKRIKDELKSWGGKTGSSKGEYSTSQSQIKEIGEKMFDGYAKIINSKEGNVTVAFCFDLGGAYLTSSEHKIQFNAMSARLKAFAVNASKESVSEEMKKQEKVLKDHVKESESLDKDKASLESDITDYKKKIEEAFAKIEQNKADQSKKKEEIKAQEAVVSGVNKKLGEIK